MLFPSLYLAVFFMDTDFVISLALNNPDAPITLTETTSLVPYLNASAVDNSTITGLNPIPSTFLTIPKIECDDDRFGEPPVASCKNAIAEIPQDPATVIRDPNRSYGGGQGIDMGTPIDGEEVYLLTYPAEENNFQLTMKSYSPPFIRCSNTAPAARPVSTSCQVIINTMKASVDLTTFGAVGIFGVEEYLPQVLTERKCSFTVDTTAPDDAASWYDLWQAAVALDGMCARTGRAGKSRFLGIGRKLVMEMKK
ncbi:MAG: hypothetical protein ASARMPRED_003174 [Alectoria sarmentosa]|nr:MAG: hypothetical protein ASARMPRED_003174 [Alectoria sarmentosa]